MLGALSSWRPRSVTVRRAFLGALVANTAIVVTGGAVRLTASGLGCPTVPKCTDTSMVATPEMGVHGAIEFGNRLLTFALTAAVVAALVTALGTRRRDLTLRAGGLLLGILAQAVLGAITVLTGLNPLTVMAHFLVSMALIAVAVDAHARTADAAVGDPADPMPEHRAVRALARLLVVVAGATLVVGTIVTGTGPHSGDKDATNRLPLDLESMTQLHADLVFLLIGLTIGLVVAATAIGARPALLRRAVQLVVIVLAQGLVGFTQYLTDLPVVLVAMHVLGACLVWIGALRVELATRAPRVAPIPVPPTRHVQNTPEPVVVA